MSDTQQASDFDINKIGQAFLDDPFPTYKLLRKNDPVHLNPDGSYFLTRYDDVVQSFRHPAMSSEKKSILSRNLATARSMFITLTVWYLMIRRSIPGCASCSPKPLRRANLRN